MAKKKHQKADQSAGRGRQVSRRDGGAGRAAEAARSTSARCAGSTGSWWRCRNGSRRRGAKVCIVFEGRDTAGKGGTIKRDHGAGEPARVQGRGAVRADRAGAVADVHPALHPALPGGRRGGHLRPQLVQPRRRRAGHGLLHAEQSARSWSRCRRSRRRWSTRASSCSSTGSRSAPTSRPGAWRAGSTIRARSGSCRDMDLKSYSRWYDYSRARDAMFAATDTPWAPWHVARHRRQEAGRLNIISHLLGQVPYEPLEPATSRCPSARRPTATASRTLPLRYIPTPF